jgi:hypothetical protein
MPDTLSLTEVRYPLVEAPGYLANNHMGRDDFPLGKKLLQAKGASLAVFYFYYPDTIRGAALPKPYLKPLPKL